MCANAMPVGCTCSLAVCAAPAHPSLCTASVISTRTSWPFSLRYNCAAYVVPATELAVAENIAHFYLSQLLDQMAAATGQPDQVLLIDNMRAVFPRDPFLGKTIGLSVFCEGPARIARLRLQPGKA